MLKPKGILASLYQSKNFSFAEGYFVGRPMNHAEPAKEQQQGADEQRPATNPQIPGGTCNRASSIRSNFGHKIIGFARCFAELCFVFVLCNRFGTQKMSQFCPVGLLNFCFVFVFFGGGEDYFVGRPANPQQPPSQPQPAQERPSFLAKWYSNLFFENRTAII